ncbi:MAG TPA: ATP-binding protein [Vicinamibacteria bacterium]|nr:ATP-binding protein [Vicinamibacteria bacterium]
MRRNAAQASALGTGASIPIEPVLDVLPQGVLLLDAELRVLKTNSRYCEIAAARGGETTGGRLFELSQGLWDVDAVHDLVEGARAGEPGSAEVELNARNGHPRAVRVHVRRLERAAAPGCLLFLVEALEDGSTAAEAARLDAIRGRDELIARAAHELRGPLGSISNWVHLLSQGSKDAALQQQGLDAIQRALNVATRLIENLHDVSLLDAGRVSLRLGLVDLAAVVDMALERPRSAAQDKGVRLESVRDVPSVPVMGDPDRLQQIVLHLLANAVECTPPGGRVEISVGREGPSWRLAVSDTGRGIPPEILPRIFGGLRPTDFTAPRPPSTLGAGLAIVRHLAELHGGTVEATSRGPGLGARFVVRLPVPALVPAGPEPVAGKDPAAAKPRPAGTGPNGRKPANPNI